MAKIKFRNIHINTNVWQYSVTNRDYVLLIPPGKNKNTIRVDIKDIISVPFDKFEAARKPDQGDNWMAATKPEDGMIKPSDIKNFIMENEKALMA